MFPQFLLVKSAFSHGLPTVFLMFPHVSWWNPKESQLPLDFQLNDFHGDPRTNGESSWAELGARLPWENHGKTMGKPWENWENHGKTMGKCGLNQENLRIHGIYSWFMIAKLVYLPRLCMVYGKYIYSFHGVYKPSYNWGAPHCSFLYIVRIWAVLGFMPTHHTCYVISWLSNQPVSRFLFKHNFDPHPQVPLQDFTDFRAEIKSWSSDGTTKPRYTCSPQILRLLVRNFADTVW